MNKSEMLVTKKSNVSCQTYLAPRTFTGQSRHLGNVMRNGRVIHFPWPTGQAWITGHPSIPVHIFPSSQSITIPLTFSFLSLTSIAFLLTHNIHPFHCLSVTFAPTHSLSQLLSSPGIFCTPVSCSPLNIHSHISFVPPLTL